MALVRKDGNLYVFELPKTHIPVSKVVTLNVFPDADKATQVEVTVPFKPSGGESPKDMSKEAKGITEKLKTEADAMLKKATAIVQKAQDEAANIIKKAKKKK